MDVYDDDDDDVDGAHASFGFVITIVRDGDDDGKSWFSSSIWTSHDDAEERQVVRSTRED